MKFFYVATTVVNLSDDQAANVHLMHLLRARMLHFVLNLNNYLMTRVCCRTFCCIMCDGGSVRSCTVLELSLRSP